MTLQKRLDKLEGKRQGQQAGPRVIVHDIVWRNDSGGVQSIGAFAKVLTVSGWQTIIRKEEELEAEFHLRAEAVAGM